MKLSQILFHLEHLCDLQKHNGHHDAWKNYQAHVGDALPKSLNQYLSSHSHLESALEGVDHAFDLLRSRLDDCRTELTTQIQSLISQYELLSEEIYRNEIVRTTKNIADPGRNIESFWNVSMPALPTEMAMIRTRLDAFNDWRVPGMIIRPGLDDWIERLVALDPLYLIDQSKVLLRPALQRFPKLYQQRVRQYAIDESQSNMMTDLPKAQMGVVFCYNLFGARPLRIIQRYMANVWDVLRPGGLFLFTYNDGDRSKAVELVERGVNCYTPGHQIRKLWQQQGFETVFEYQSDLGWNYAEIRRPGVIKTLRGGQSLAKIRPIH